MAKTKNKEFKGTDKYYLPQDLGEIVNLANDPAYATVVEELRELVEGGYLKALIEP